TWLAGERSGADAYLFVTLRWAQRVGVDLSGLDALAAFFTRMSEDADVQAALKAEGLS
ncbi:glutathione S-transferase, partial [Kosakonia sp. H7A]